MDNIYVLSCLLACIETVAITSLTKYSKNNNMTCLIMGILIYCILIPILIIYSVKFDSIGTIVFIWNIVNIVAMILVGYYIFDERVNHLHIISLMLGISSIVLLYIANKDS